MQRDMHFYAVYALARAAGITAGAAQTIACASQFVDDATDDDVVSVLDKTVLSTMTSHKTLDARNAVPGDQWRIWVPFHFLPGNHPQSGSFNERMICRKDSAPAKRMLAFALSPGNEQYWPHLIGISAHVYADTFSHFGFTGFACNCNKVKEQTIRITGEGGKNLGRFLLKVAKNVWTGIIGLFAEHVPVGHGAVGVFPDHPCISWRFEYENGRHQPEDTDRNNHASFLQGCARLHEFFRDYLRARPSDGDGTSGRSWQTIAPAVENILKGDSSTSLEQRERRWREAILAGKFCSVTDEDRKLYYSEHTWDLESCSKLDDPEALLHARAFIRAAYRHRQYVLQELLPELGLITY